MKTEEIPFDDVGHEISKYYPVKSNRDKILLIGHYGGLGSSQFLLLNIAKELLKQDIEVVIFIKEFDVLFDSYKELAPTFLVDSEEKIEYYIREVSKYGFQSAITNTTPSGNLIPTLKRYDFYTISLIHELPGMIRKLNAEPFVEIIAKTADLVVFPSKYVCERFESIYKVQGKKVIQAQGLYKSYDEFDREKSRELLEAKYDIPKDSNIILNIGTGEKRKGLDIFYEVSQEFIGKNNIFIWVGLITEEMEEYIEKIKNAKNIILTGFISDKEEIMSFYAACDLFFLSSREDPFPSVVLEAFNAEKPVIAFENAGGFQDIVINDYSGYLVEYGSIDSIVDKIRLICGDEKLKERLGTNGKEISKSYDFSKYVKSLKSYCDEGVLEINRNNLMESLNRDIGFKNQEIKKLKQKNEEKNQSILDLKKTNTNLRKNNSKLKKANTNLKKNNAKLKKTNTKLKKERKEILSSSSWKVTSPLRKFKHFSKKIMVSTNKNKNPIENELSESLANNQKDKINQKEIVSSSEKSKEFNHNERYMYSVKSIHSPISYLSPYKTFISNNKIKRVNLFLDEIDETVYKFEKLFSFLMGYCNHYDYSLRIIYSYADFQILKDFLKKNRSILPNISVLNLKENNYLEIGLDEKYVSTSWKNGGKLIKTNSIGSPIYFYLTDLDECTNEEYLQLSKLCYSENIVILNDNPSKLDKLMKFNFNLKYNINVRLNKEEKKLCYDMGNMPLEGIELFNYLFSNQILDNDWNIDIISNQDLSKIILSSKKILSPISEKLEDYDLFLNLINEEPIDSNNENSNPNKNSNPNNDKIDKNYMYLYYKKELDNSYNSIEISKDNFDEFHNFNISKPKNEEFNVIGELFKKFMEDL